MHQIKLSLVFAFLVAACSPAPADTTEPPIECPEPITCPAPMVCPTCTVCQVCPAPVVCPVAIYADPCAGDPVGAVGHYDDAHGVTFAAGGTVRLNGIAQQILTFPAGQPVTEIRVRIVPKAHSSLAHVHLPAISVWRESVVAGNNLEEFVGRAADPLESRSMDPNDATVANEYSQPHDLVLKLNEVPKAGVSYLVNVVGEWEESANRGQAQDMTVCGTVADSTVDP